MAETSALGAAAQKQVRRKHRREKAESRRRSSPSARVVYRAVLEEGEDELVRPSAALAWSGFAAGLSMGFSLVVQGLLRAALPEAHWQPLLVKLGYAAGFLIVVLGRQQLFTENTLTVVLPLLLRKDRRTLLDVARLWGVVLAANVTGALGFAALLALTPAFDPPVRQAFDQLAAEAASLPPGTMLLRAILAGWLIATMVWLLPFARTARVGIIVAVTWVIGVGHFPHVVAGSVDTLYTVLRGQLAFSGFLTGFFLPTLAGNVIGGVALVAALAHAQVAGGQESAEAGLTPEPPKR